MEKLKTIKIVVWNRLKFVQKVKEADLLAVAAQKHPLDAKLLKIESVFIEEPFTVEKKKKCEISEEFLNRVHPIDPLLHEYAESHTGDFGEPDIF
jgi:hypothetical protein